MVTVLILDNSLVMRTILTYQLTRHGYPTSAYADPHVALQAIREQHIPTPDVLLVCRDLPHLDGYQVSRVARQWHVPPLVIMLLLEQEQDGVIGRIKARFSGAHTTLIKPFKIEQLLQTLSRALDERRERSWSH